MVSIISVPATGTMMPPPTPLSVTKRPSYGHKRDSSYIDTDDENGLSTSTKRLKVAFNPDVEYRILDDTQGIKSMDLVKEEVRQAIERHAAHDDDLYSKLVASLKLDPYDADALSGELLLKYIVALEARISTLGECRSLVAAVLGIAWLGRDDVFVAAYAKFCLALATANAKWLQSIIDRLIALLAHLPSSMGNLPDESRVSRSVMTSRVHTILRTFYKQIPAAGSCLIQALKAEYPNDLATLRSHQQYQNNMLKIRHYAPEIRNQIMTMIVQRVVALDVQIQRDLEEGEDEAEEHFLQHHRQYDDLEDDSDAESVSTDDSDLEEEEEERRELSLKVSKMDATMDLLFEYYDPLVRNGTSANDNEAYQQLLSHFATSILPHRTRHAQFLMFHFSQISLDHTTIFAQQLVDQAFSNGLSIQRYTAIAYLSSLIARGAHINRQTVQEVFSLLCDYLEDARKRYEPQCRGPDRLSYGMYYAIVQAMLYIFCFRWKDLVDEDQEAESEEDDILADNGELSWIPRIREVLQRNIFGPMNPLKVCAPTIVAEFANIARHVRFMEVLSKVESNKRIRLGQTQSYYGQPGGIDIGRRETALDRKNGEAHHQLQLYFPFDPYHLAVSKKWVEGDYNQWKLPRGMRRDNDDEDAYDDSEDESDDDSIDGVNDPALEILSNSS